MPEIPINIIIKNPRAIAAITPKKAAINVGKNDFIVFVSLNFLVTKNYAKVTFWTPIGW